MRGGFLSLLFLVGSASQLFANEFPSAMAVLGDSMSEAILADFSKEEGLGAGEAFRMLRLAGIEDPKERRDAFRERYAARSKAWATGSSDEDLVESHFERLLEYSPDLKAFNFAVASSKAEDLSPQVDQLLEVQESEDLRFDYISVLIGANDLSGETYKEMTPVMEYASHIEKALQRIIDVNQEMKILLVGVPPILKVFEETRDSVAYRLLGRSISCNQIRRSVYGNNLVFDTDHAETYKKVRAIYEQYQNALVGIEDRILESSPSVEIRAVVHYDTVQKSDKIISVDCFHPSEFGQAELAEVTWINGFWPDLGAAIQF